MGRKLRTRLLSAVLFLVMFILITGCAEQKNTEDSDTAASASSDAGQNQEVQTQNSTAQGSSVQGTEKNASVTEGTEEYRGFTLDNVLHSETEGDIHFNLYVPDSYDGSRPYALFMTLPGYEGLYFQGVGENLYSEDFGFTAQEYNPEMIIAAPQLSDWGETSADQTIALTEYLLDNYHIDPEKVYAEGYSGGGRPCLWLWERGRSCSLRISSAAPSGTGILSRRSKAGRRYILSSVKTTSITVPDLPGRPMRHCAVCTGMKGFRRKKSMNLWYWISRIQNILKARERRTSMAEGICSLRTRKRWAGSSGIKKR